jgi:hypothetical protein
MTDYQEIKFKGKTISLVDLSNGKSDEAIKTLQIAQKKIATMAPKSALILTDETNGEVTKEIVSAIMDFAKNNTPYVKASAVTGAEKLKALLLTNLSTTVGRDIKNFENRSQAMDWLASQP